MKCVDCLYYYITPEDILYPRCHFEPSVDWYKAPCEYDGEEELEEFWQNEDMGFDPYLGCYTDDC